MSWKTYKVTVTRLIEQEAQFYVTAKDAEAAQEQAVDTAPEIADAIWKDSDCEPHTYGVDRCEEADKPKEFQ